MERIDLKKGIERIASVGSWTMRRLHDRLNERLKFREFSSENYWIERYAKGGNSGEGSYGEHAEFKASIINGFLSTHGIESVIEFGCGDGNQLGLANYGSYIGLDVSDQAISCCRKRFHLDKSKSFRLMKEYRGERAQIALSLDVLYHLVEDCSFEAYMRILFNSADRYIIIYSTNTDVQEKGQGSHVRHREFTRWIGENVANWELIWHVPNERGSLPAEFFIYEKI